MESSNFFLNGLGYITLIIVSGIALLTCFVFFIVRLSQDHKHKWNWLIAVAVSVIVLCISIYLFVVKVVDTVKNIGTAVEQKMEESFEELNKLDSSYKYAMFDSNEMVRKLRDFEQFNNISNTPKEFYVYYGFKDYHRLPLTYPFSLHSSDILETATLYNEENVTEFNVNDNGEVETGRPGVSEFAFDNSAFIGKNKDEKGKDYYWVFSLNNPKLDFITNIQTSKEAFKIARKEYNYRGYDTLISLMDYNGLFK